MYTSLLNTCDMKGDVVGTKYKVLLRHPGGDKQQITGYRDVKLQEIVCPIKKCRKSFSHI